MFQISSENYYFRKRRFITRTAQLAETNSHFYSSVHPRLGLGNKKINSNNALLNSYNPISNFSTPKNIKILPKLQKEKDIEQSQQKIKNLLNIQINPIPKFQRKRTSEQDCRRIFYRSQKKSYQQQNLSSSTQDVKMNFKQHSYTSFEERSDKLIKYIALSNRGKRPYNQDKYICRSDLLTKVQFKSSMLFGQKQKFKISYDLYGVFDGHGGSACSQFLKQNFANFLLRSKYLDSNQEEALKETFQKLEQKFLSTCQTKRNIQTSGSCAVVCLVVDAKIYVANLGDSRALMFNNQEYCELTKDHKPSDNHQKMRILRCGGKIYKQQDYQIKHLKVFNQVRITPGNLNVSRTIGDIQVKVKKYGGLPGMVSSQPQIKIFDKQNYDFLLLASDGLFQAFTNSQIHSFYKKMLKHSQNLSSEILMNKFANQLIKQAQKKSSDNITLVVVLLKN